MTISFMLTPAEHSVLKLMAEPSSMASFSVRIVSDAVLKGKVYEESRLPVLRTYTVGMNTFPRYLDRELMRLATVESNTTVSHYCRMAVVDWLRKNAAVKEQDSMFMLPKFAADVGRW